MTFDFENCGEFAGQIDEYQSCKKEQGDEGCEDCGAGRYCPLLKKSP